MPLSIHSKRRVLYIKTEGATPGTFVGKTILYAVANAVIPPDSIKYTPKVEFADRKPEGSSLQPIASVAGASSATVAFSSRLIGPPTKGVAGPLTDLFKSSAMSEVLVATTSATFTENPNSQTRLSIGVGMIQEDGLLEIEWAIAGAAPSKCDFGADGLGKPLMIEWEFLGKPAYETGTLVAVDDASPNVGITFVDDDANGFRFLGLTVTSGTMTREISKFSFSRGLSVELDTSITDPTAHGYCKYGPTDPVLKIDPAKVPVATANDVATMIAGGKASAGFTLTNAAGKTFSMAFPNLQPVSMSDDARGNVSTWGIEAHCRRSQTGAAVDASDAFTFIFA
jgi:hypothetical protein